MRAFLCFAFLLTACAPDVPPIVEEPVVPVEPVASGISVVVKNDFASARFGINIEVQPNFARSTFQDVPDFVLREGGATTLPGRIQAVPGDILILDVVVDALNTTFPENRIAKVPDGASTLELAWVYVENNNSLRLDATFYGNDGRALGFPAAERTRLLTVTANTPGLVDHRFSVSTGEISYSTEFPSGDGFAVLGRIPVSTVYLNYHGGCWVEQNGELLEYTWDEFYEHVLPVGEGDLNIVLWNGEYETGEWYMAFTIEED